MQTSASPSSPRAFGVVALLLIAVGFSVSLYLSYTKLADIPVACVEGTAFNCETVQAHPIGQIAGIPVSVLGLLMYAALAVLEFGRGRVAILESNGEILFFGVVLLGWLFSMWLVYAQANIIHAWCIWCLTHEVAISGLLVLAIWRVRRHFLSLR
ncbi:MAG: vitamin K epoxide reductase family protein [Chloroflexi bacterium]|nr:vitamin K epoxide reductase family protein [Chloroflexota bacterium]